MDSRVRTGVLREPITHSIIQLERVCGKEIHPVRGTGLLLELDQAVRPEWGSSARPPTGLEPPV